jgi:tetratricopeptide (TPR) repeat protein
MQEMVNIRLAEKWENRPATEAQVAEAGAEIEKAAALHAGLEDEMQADLAVVLVAYTKKDWTLVRKRCAEAFKKFAGRPGLEEYYLWLALTPGTAKDYQVLLQPVHNPGQVYGFQILVVVPNAEAARQLDGALDLHPRFPLALYARSLFRIQAGSFADARKDLDAVLELWPDLPAAFVARAMVRDRKNEIPAAMADLDRALQIAKRPSDRRDSHLLRFAILRDQGKEKDALESLDRCVDSEPTDWLARYIRGEERLRLSQYPEAMEDLQACLKNQPRFTHGMERRGYAYLCMKKYDLAMKDYNEAMRLGPNSPCLAMNLTYRGQIYKETGKIQEALADLAEALKRSSSPVVVGEALKSRVQLYLQMARYDEALADAQGILKVARNDAQTAWAYHAEGIAHTLKGEYRDAIGSLNRSIQLVPTDGSTYYVRAQARRAANDPKGAVEDARKALQLGLPENQRTLALKLLQDLNAKP